MSQDWRHPERSRFSGGAKDLACSANEVSFATRTGPPSSCTAPSKLEYDVRVRRVVSASVAAFGVLAVASSLSAQTDPAVTSPAVGGRPPAVIPFTGTVGLTKPPASPDSPAIPAPAVDSHRHHHRDSSPQVVLYPVPVPYAVDLSGTGYDDASDDSDANYQGGPTVFDRRGSGADSYIPPARDAFGPHSELNSDREVSEEPQAPTLLVFKDGHDLEVGNYAIVGETLFDLTPGHARRVALADLDLDATRKKNQDRDKDREKDRGVTFPFPASRANSRVN
jgi:hypothetical protein